MQSFSVKDLSPDEIYFYLIGGINPRPIAFVSTISKTGIYNLAPFSFFNAFSGNPPIIIFSPASTGDNERPYKDTYVNLMDTGECVVQMVSYAMREQMLVTAKNYPAEINEFELANLTPIKSDLVKAPRVKESPFQMECKLLEMKSYGTQSGAGNLAICEVLKFHIDENIFKPGTNRIDPTKMDLIGRNGGHYYTRSNAEAMFEMK